jgi:hypothetical protein
MLKPVQRGLSSQHSAISAARFRLARDKAERAISLPQEQRAYIRRDGPAIKSRCDFPASEAGKIEGIRTTLCRHRRGLLRQENPLWQKNFR